MNLIVNLSSSLKQVVQIPTRLNPDATLDKIVTTISKYYEQPYSLPPIQNDENNQGKDSDHLIIVMKPKPLNCSKYITFCPFPQSSVNLFGQWIQVQTWQDIF